MSDLGDDYNQLSFKRMADNDKTNLRKYKSQNHKQFFESKLNSSAREEPLGYLVESTLDKLHDKLKGDIEHGVQGITPSQTNLKALNKKMLVDFAGKETQNTLGVIRARECSLLTREDYENKRKVLAEKLKQLYEDPDSDEENIALKLNKLERETIGEPTRSLVGRPGEQESINEKEHIDMCKQMVDKLREQRRERRQKLREHKQRQRELRARHQAQREKHIQSEREEQERAFKEKQDKIKETIEERKQGLEKSKTEMVKETKKRVRKSPLHSKLINDFEMHYTMPELQKRKQTLAEIRNFRRPVRLSEIRDHSAKKKELLQSKLQEYFKKREDLHNLSMDVADKYKSKFWQAVKEREQKEELDKKMQKEDIKDRQKKKIDYAKNVMELYKPKISKRKKLEMNLIKKNMENPHSLIKLKQDLKTAKSNHNKSVVESLDRGIGSDSGTTIHKRKSLPRARPVDQKRYSYHQTPSNQHPFIKHDYLSQIRQKSNKNNKSQLYDIEQWQNEITKNKLTEKERMEYIKLKAAKMEEEMTRKERMAKVNNSPSMSEAKQINGLLVDSIKAKLALLDGMGA